MLCLWNVYFDTFIIFDQVAIFSNLGHAERYATTNHCLKERSLTIFALLHLILLSQNFLYLNKFQHFSNPTKVKLSLFWQFQQYFTTIWSLIQVPHPAYTFEGGQPLENPIRHMIRFRMRSLPPPLKVSRYCFLTKWVISTNAWWHVNLGLNHN